MQTVLPAPGLAPSQPPIVLDAEWTALQGHVYGLPQPSIHGAVSVLAPAGLDIPALARQLLRLIDGTPYPAQPWLDATDPDAALALLLAYWSGALQRHFRVPTAPVGRIGARPALAPGRRVFELALPFHRHAAAVLGLKQAADLINGLLTGALRLDSVESQLRALDRVQRNLSPHAVPGLNTFSLLDAALRLDVPISRMTAETWRLGQGRLQRWMESTITDRTPSIGVKAARRKMETAQVLRAIGLPGAVHRRVGSVEEAVAAAQAIGYPVVVKPGDLDQGKGVAADLRDAASVAQAFLDAARLSRNILVEKWEDGFTHRLTVVNGGLLRVSRRIAGGVFGDGRSTVQELIGQLHGQEAYQRRVRTMGRPLLELDAEALGLLAQRGQSAQTVPAAGEYVRLRRRDNVNAGATNEVCPLDTIHPDNVRLALDATRALKLDFSGVDLIIRDITRSWLEIGGLICEINAQPQVVAPEQPFLYDELVRGLFPDGWRVPAHLVIVPEDEDARAAISRRWLQRDGCNAVSDRSGLRIDGRMATLGFPDSFRAAQAVLCHPGVMGATCLMTLHDIVRFGLPANRWSSVTLGLRQPMAPAEEALAAQVAQRLSTDLVVSFMPARRDHRP